MSERKIEYGLEMFMGVIGGIILIFVGAVGSAEFYLKLIEIAKKYFAEGSFILTYLETMFIILATMGGITVIIGSIFVGFGRRRIGGWLIGIGAGISLSILLTKIVILGPVIQQYVRQQEFITAVRVFGFELGLLGLGVFLSFLATLTNYRWMAFMFILSILAMFVGATGDVTLLEQTLTKLGISQTYLTYLSYLENLLLYIGLLFLLTSLIVGAGRIGVAKAIVAFGLISILPAILIVSAQLYTIVELQTYSRAISIYLLLIGEIIFIVKAKPVHE